MNEQNKLDDLKAEWAAAEASVEALIIARGNAETISDVIGIEGKMADATMIAAGAAQVYITALEAALQKAQGPYKFDTILVTPEIVAMFRERGTDESWIAEWTTRRFAQLYEHHSSKSVWWVTCFQWGATEIPDDLVKAARAAYIEYMTTP